MGERGHRSSRLSLSGEQRKNAAINCKVCMSVYDEGPRHKPLVLNCRHTFCSGCIADTLMTPEDRSKVLCPLCKSKTSMGKKGINGLPVNSESIKAVRGLEKQTQKDVQKSMKSVSKDLSAQPAVQLGASRSEPVKLKGILKVTPKQDKSGIDIRREPFSHIENGHRSTGVPGTCQECPHCMAGKATSGLRIQPDEHTVIVRSVKPLHPPPTAVLNSIEQVPSNHQLQQQQQNPMTIMEVLQENTNLGPNPDIKHDHHQMNADILSDLPITQVDSSLLELLPADANTETISRDLTPDPFRDQNDQNGSGPDPQSDRKNHPVVAVLYMASSSNAISRNKVEKIAAVDSEAVEYLSPEVRNVAPLTESQQNLPSSAKYVGRFGKYSEKSQQQTGALISPQKIASSIAGDRLAIADSASSSVNMFTVRGEYVASFSAAGLTGGVCFLTDKELAVATEKGVQIYQAPGTLKKTIPIGYVTAVARFKQGFVAAMKKRLSVCKAFAGSVIHSVNGTRHPGLLQKLIPFENIIDVAVSPKDELCILEWNSVLVTDEEGVIVYVIQPNIESICGPIGRSVALAFCELDEKTGSDSGSISGSGSLIGSSIISGSGKDSGSGGVSGIVVADSAHRRVVLFGIDGQFQRCLVSLNEGSGEGDHRSGNINGIAVSSRSRMLYMVATGTQMAEVRVYAM